MNNQKTKAKLNKTPLTEPISEFKKHRRHLPHFQSPNAIYFITTRCCQARRLTYEDLDIVLNSIKYLDGEKYILYAAVVLPDHFHIIIQPLEKKKSAYYSVSEIMHSIKSFSAHKIIKLNKRRSNVSFDNSIENKYMDQIWQHENFDRIIRNEKEFEIKIDYIMNNPVDAGLVEYPDEYKWLYVGE